MAISWELILVALVGAGAGIITALSGLAAQRARVRQDAAAAVDARWKAICDEQQERLGQLQEQVAVLEARSAAQRTQIDELWVRVHQGETAIIARDTRIALLEAAGMAKDGKIATLEGQVAALRQDVTRLEAENKALREQR